MSQDYAQVPAPTTAIRATLRDLLQAQITALELTPKWLWEMEFGLHVWPILERFHREGDELATDLIGWIQNSKGPEQAITILKDYLCLNEEPKGPPPW